MAAVHLGLGVGFLSWWEAGSSIEGPSSWRQSTLAWKFDLLSGEQMVGLGEGEQARLGREQEGVWKFSEMRLWFLNSYGFPPEIVSPIGDLSNRSLDKQLKTAGALIIKDFYGAVFEVKIK